MNTKEIEMKIEYANMIEQEAIKGIKEILKRIETKFVNQGVVRYRPPNKNASQTILRSDIRRYK